MQAIILRSNAAQRLKMGHDWVYSNEIDTARSPLRNFQPGEQINIIASDGEKLGTGYINPHSLICVRRYSLKPEETLSTALIKQKIGLARALREECYAAPFYRLVFAEADALPGLIIDRFDTIFAVQIGTVGMEQVKEEIITALVELFKPEGIILKNKIASRETEGLVQEVSIAYGEVPVEMELIENNLRFVFPLSEGQKTGWFYDQRDNRMRLMPYVKNKKVLDVFSYLGAFAIYALHFGASEVLTIDSSMMAAEFVGKNAALNQMSGRITALVEDAFVALKKLKDEAAIFDVVLLDPPAFIKKQKDFKEGALAYQRLHELALKVLKTGGFLITSSCSMHLSRTDLNDAVVKAAMRRRARLQLIEQGGQAKDHPIHPGIAETEYLKMMIYRNVTP